MTVYKPLFVVRETKNMLGKKRYRVNLVGPNGEKICTSESLNSKEAAKRNIAATREYSPDAEEQWL